MRRAFSKVLLIIVLAIILGAAYFLWQIYGNKWFNKGETTQAPKIEITEKGDQKIVKNLTDGYQVAIYKTWNVNFINKGHNEGSLKLTPPNYEVSTAATESDNNCNLEIFINRNNQKLTLNNWLEINSPGGILSEQNVEIGAAHLPAVKVIGNELGDYIAVYILNPINYNVNEIVLNTNSEKKCLDAFNNLLDSYSIY
ncbi:MAG: hypothetical protein PHV78_01210 [Patescibacteria group bacterium]|nr:hypothetical protein [Patescibacteria group bacterium]MDD5121223.1 hypothetical protein [Patescibacteria group bacterium]MDD5221748.1 hypothetical protein [Patescibacteria group bacterium]MDD5395858.1 hypothetical protein [Patescibacteria group bacterium]